MRRWISCLTLGFLSASGLTSLHAAPLRVAVVGSNLQALPAVLTKAGLSAQMLAAIPMDAADLARTADVVIVSTTGNKHPTPEQEIVLESFVRAGGGLWIDAAQDPAGGWLGSMTSALALDGRSESWVTLDPADGSPLTDLDFKSLPRLDHGRSLAPPGAGQLDLLNMLCPWYFSKPLWLDGWQTWVTGPAPHRLSFLTVTRYGAGRTALWGAGDGLADRALLGWTSYPELCRRVIGWLAPREPVTVFPRLRPVHVAGLTGPSFWSQPLESGLKGMAQKETLSEFQIPPVALLESGYLPTADASPSTAVLFGASANAPSVAAVVLRAPFGETPVAAASFEPKSEMTTSIREVAFVGADGKESSVSLPHTIPVLSTNFPTVGNVGNARDVHLPAQWRIAYTLDADSREDSSYSRTDYNDTQWKTAPLGKQTTTLFGRTTGFDGAIWYRGHIEVSAEASAAPDASLLFGGGGQHLEIYADGKRLAIEPKSASVPLSKIGAGDHLIAVRTFGELRTNYGLLSIAAVRLPLLWRSDPHQQGWAENWANLDANLSAWQGVSNSFAAEPAGREALEGWIRLSVDVPEQTAPFAVLFRLAMNVESCLFINGVAQESHGFERQGTYQVPGTSFHPGRNVVVFWSRFSDTSNKSLSSEVVATQPHIYRATIHADHAGSTLQAELRYEIPLFQPYSASIRVGGHVVGGWIGNPGSEPVLLAPHALAAGDNAVEISVAGGSGGAFGLKSLRIRDVPENVRLPVPGWSRLPTVQAPANWFQPAFIDRAWEPAGTACIQDWEKSWTYKSGPDLGNSNFVYRTHLFFTERDLTKNLTLFLKGAAIHELFVNGQRVQPDDESFYSLNHALKAGDNVLALQPTDATYRGMNILLPTGRARGVYMPELRMDVAALEPAQPELAAYRLNRTFPVSTWNPPANSKPLFRWPNGNPAVVLHQIGRQCEIVAAPGIFDQTFPGPNMAILAKQSGATSTVAYEYGEHLNRDALEKEPYEQWIPALLAYGEGRGAWITGLQSTADTAQLSVHGPAGGKAELAWRLLDWEGMYLFSGTAELVFGADGTARANVPLPDLTDGTHDAGTGMGCSVRLCAALLSADRREVLGHLERIVSPEPAVTGHVRLDSKIAALDARNGVYERRVLHMALDELAERSVYLPGETAHATAYLENSTGVEQSVSVLLSATGAVNGEAARQKIDLKLGPFEKRNLVLVIDAAATTFEQPWKVFLEVTQHGAAISRDRCAFTVAQPRGAITDILEATRQGRQSGGYMWQMTPHALAIEHRRGTDAMPVPGPWWTSVRFGGDGNWLVAEGMEYDAQAGLLWGPFFDQGRGEEINSYGWFPNGQSFRQWWAPYAVRELLRTFGDQSVVFALSDWWQYDAGYPEKNYVTLEMFNDWLAAHKNQTIAGHAIDGRPIAASTLSAMSREIENHYQPVFDYFVAEGLSHSAAFTGRQLEGTAPGTVQLGQGAYAGRLPAVEGGVNLATEWAHYENLAILDADNHYFAGPYQYALEAETFRALGVNNGLDTQWERPMDYHSVKDTKASLVPMDASFWENRLLDSRWQVIGDSQGEFQRVLNLTHDEYMADPARSSLIGDGTAKIGNALLPAHWRINDQLSNLSMTIGVAKPLSPLLIVGESDVDWTVYYGMLGKFRDAGLSLGGAVSISELAKLKSADIPGLVWLPATQVSGPLLAAVQEKVEQGVPLFIIGKIPASEGPDWFKWLGVDAQDGPPTNVNAQQVDSAWQMNAVARGIAQAFPGPMPASSYSVKPGGLLPIVQRAGRLVVGMSNQPKKKVVFNGLLYPLHLADDAAVRKLAVETFNHLQKQTVAFDDHTGGYAFAGLDGALYIVIENRESFAVSAHLAVNAAVGSAVNLLTGEKMDATPSPDGADVTIPLQADGATVVAIRK